MRCRQINQLYLGDKRPEFRDQLLKVFGPPGSAVRADNNLFFLFQGASPKDLPYLYLACGSADDFLQVNRDFAAQLSSRGAPMSITRLPADTGGTIGTDRCRIYCGQPQASYQVNIAGFRNSRVRSVGRCCNPARRFEKSSIERRPHETCALRTTSARKAWDPRL
jgi:hypothetical protein